MFSKNCKKPRMKSFFPILVLISNFAGLGLKAKVETKTGIGHRLGKNWRSRSWFSDISVARGESSFLASSIQLLSINLYVKQGEFKGFCPKSCYLRPSSNRFMNVSNP